MGKGLSWQKLAAESRTSRRSKKVILKVDAIQEAGRYPEAVYPFVPGAGITRDTAYAEAVAQAEQAFQAEVARRLALTPRKRVYVLVHGFANTFDDAAFAMAEMWHFLGREGVPVIYTWPAGHKGLLRGYNYDRESGEFTIFHLKQFLRALAGTPGLEDIVLMAHSRGTDVAASAFRDLFIESAAAGADPIERLRISNVILLAPDMDMEVTTQRFGAEGVMAGAGQVTVYVSENDRAIGAADWLFGSIQRLGTLTAGTLTGKAAGFSARLRSNLERLPMLQCIEFRDKTGFMGHAYYRQSPSASSDLVLMLRYNKQAGDPARPLKEAFHNYWVIEKGYPGDAPH
jgi:esterase/lipase superfamily enzyme